MSKKLKMIPSIFKTNQKQPWQWRHSCNHPKTLSFRASNDDVFKTVNSVFLDTCAGQETPESWFTNSSDWASTFSGGGADDRSDDNDIVNSSVETIIRGVRSSETRLFFEPGGETSSILKKAEAEEERPAAFEAESVALAMESDDPYTDFKRSMEEMVESHGLKDWDCLEELLRWYLKMNGKTNHGFIVAAFADLLVGMSVDFDINNVDSSSSTAPAVCCSSEDCTTTTSYSSADSCFSSPSSPDVSPTGVVVVVGDDEEGDIVVQSS